MFFFFHNFQTILLHLALNCNHTAEDLAGWLQDDLEGRHAYIELHLLDPNKPRSQPIPKADCQGFYHGLVVEFMDEIFQASETCPQALVFQIIDKNRNLEDANRI